MEQPSFILGGSEIYIVIDNEELEEDNEEELAPHVLQAPPITIDLKTLLFLNKVRSNFI